MLIEKPGAGGGLNHLGVEAPTPEQVDAALSRFREAGLHTEVAEQDVCCHPGQHMTYLTPGHTSAARLVRSEVTVTRSRPLQTEARTDLPEPPITT